MAKASNIPEDDAWFQAYRKAQEARAGRGMINGMPVQQALGKTPAQVVADNPVLRAPGVAQIPAVTPQQEARAMAVAEDLGAKRAEQQRDQKNDSRGRYNEFLLASGIDPNTIGGARLTGTSANRTIEAPTLAQQEAAVNAANQESSLQNNARIAARRALTRGDGGMWAATIDALRQRNNTMGGGRSSERNADFWLNRLLGAESLRNLTFPSNGY